MDVTVCVIQYYTDQWVVHINMPRLSPASLAIKIVNGNDFRIFLHNHVFGITHILPKLTYTSPKFKQLFNVPSGVYQSGVLREPDILSHSLRTVYTIQRA